MPIPMPPAIVQDMPAGTTADLPSALAPPNKLGGVRFRITDMKPARSLPTLDSAHVRNGGVVDRVSQFNTIEERALIAVRMWSEQAKSLEPTSRDYQDVQAKIALVSRCLIAADVYSVEPGGNTTLPAHIVRLEGSALQQFFGADLASAVFSDVRSGYYAALYFDTSKQSFVLANRGTSDVPDWATNAQQAVGLPAKQYDQAVALAKSVKAAIDQRYGAHVSLEFVGHSLGGGLASAQSIVVEGCPTITFNAAGVHQFTIVRHKSKLTEDSTKNITAYQVKGEILTVVQGSMSAVFQGAVVPRAAGNPVVIAPEQVMPRLRPAKNMAESIERHMMSKVLTEVLRASEVPESAIRVGDRPR